MYDFQALIIQVTFGSSRASFLPVPATIPDALLGIRFGSARAKSAAANVNFNFNESFDFPERHDYPQPEGSK